MSRPNEWPQEKIDELTRLWGEGATTAKIAKALGVTKSAITGKVHRLKLPGRPSPIRSPRYALAKSNAWAEKRAAAPRPVKLSPRQVRDLQIPTWKISTRSKCRFPLWGTERPTHAYCGAPVVIRPRKRFSGSSVFIAEEETSWCGQHFAYCHDKAPERE